MDGILGSFHLLVLVEPRFGSHSDLAICVKHLEIKFVMLVGFTRVQQELFFLDK